MPIPLLHLREGISKPNLPSDGGLRLFSASFCPYSQRVALVLTAKKIPYHTIYIHLREKPDWYTDFSPTGKVPALQLAGIAGQPTLAESLLITEYLDDQYKEPPLLPTDPLRRALDKMLIDNFSPAIDAAYQIFYTKNPPADALPNFENTLDVFERELIKRGTPYFGGNQMGMVDYMIWPWFERLRAIKHLLEFEIYKARFGNLLKWIELVAVNETVKQLTLDSQMHANFMVQTREGRPNYDMVFEDL